MHNWESLTVRALRDLGADAVMVPGAKLRQLMVELGNEEGLDVVAHVANSGSSFSKLVATVNGVTVRSQPGSDVLIGLHDAVVPDDAPRPDAAKIRYGALRKDVYQAFTRVSNVPYVYLPGSDKFVKAEQAEGTSIEVDGPTLESLISVRRKFVEMLPQDAQQPLLDALDRSASPLSDFRREAIARGIFEKWSAMQAEVIRSHVVEWAKRHDLTPRDSWFQNPRVTNSPHQTLTLLAPYLTAEEIRELRIPFRAIEALLSDLHEK